jgi:hypothetical protein
MTVRPSIVNAHIANLEHNRTYPVHLSMLQAGRVVRAEWEPDELIGSWTLVEGD